MLMTTPATDHSRHLDNLQQQQRFMEMFTATLVREYSTQGGLIYCEKGCGSCCSLAVNCTFFEALLLAERLEEELLQLVDRYTERLTALLSSVTTLHDYLRLHRRDSGGCPLLGSDGSCRTYEFRPLSCRALLSTRESRWCGTDFAELTAAEKEAFVASLDRAVTAFPLHYLAASRNAGSELEGQALMMMISEYGFSLYGNMPVMVHLASRWKLAEKLGNGAASIRELLNRAGLNHPLLLVLEEP